MADIFDEIDTLVGQGAGTAPAQSPVPALRGGDGDGYARNEALEPGEATKGLRQGALGLRGQFNSAVAGVARAAGFDGIADEHDRRAAELNARAAATAPRVASYKDVHSLRDAMDYTAGLLGSAVPSAALGVGAAGAAALSRGRINPLLATTAAYAPLEAGDVLQRQQQDPEARLRSPAENLGAAALTGTASALGGALLPSLVGRQLAGATAGGALHTGGPLSILGAGVSGAATEAAGGAAGEIAKQQGVALGSVDWDPVKEAAVGGAVAGAPLGMAGGAGERLYTAPLAAGRGAKELAGAGWNAARDLTGRAAGRVAGALREARQSQPTQAAGDWMARVEAGLGEAQAGLAKSISERVADAKGWYGELMAADDVPAEIKARAQEAAKNWGSKANQAWLKSAVAARAGMQEAARKALEMPETVQRIREAVVDDTADRILAGTPLGDLAEYGRRQGQALYDYVQENSARSVDWTKAKAAELYEQADPETRARLEQAIANPGETANQVFVAGQVKAAGARSRVSAGLERLASKLPRWDDIADKSMGDWAKEGRGAAQRMADRTKQRLSELPDDIVNLTLRDVADFSRRQGETSMEWVSRAATALSQAVDLDPETRARLEQAIANPGDAANQAYVAAKAGLDRAYGATKAGAGWATDAAKAAGAAAGARVRQGLERMAGDSPDVRKSEDYSGIRRVLAERLAPHVPAEVMQDAALRDRLAEGVRGFIAAASRDDFVRVQELADDMRAVLGDDAENILADVYQAVGQTDPQRTERFFGSLNQMRELGLRSRALGDVIAANLPQGSRADAEQLTDVLKQWATGGAGNGLGPSASQFFHANVRGEIDQLFGPKAAQVYKALEDYALTERADPGEARRAPRGGGEAVEAEAFTPDALEEGEAQRQYFGGGRNPNARELMRNPVTYEAQWGKADSPAHKLIERLKAQFPTASVRFETEDAINRAEGSEGGDRERGLVVVESAPDSTKLTSGEIDAARLDTARYARSESRLEVPGGLILDAQRLTRTMLKKAGDAQRSDGAPSAVRALRAFLDGVSQLTEQYGAFELPDSLVIANAPRRITLGEARLARVENALDAASDRTTQRLDELRKAYKAASARERGEIVAEANRLIEQRALARDRELANDFESRQHETSLGQLLLEAEGRQQSGGEDNIHVVAATQTPDDMVSRSNMDGSAKFVRDNGQVNTKPLQLLATRLNSVESAIARKVAGRLEVLRKGIYSMSGPDQQRLLALDGASKVSAVAEVVNALARKYKGVLAAPSPQTRFERRPDLLALGEEEPPGPKAVAAKKAAFLERAASGDKALIEELQASGDAKGLQRAAQALLEQPLRGEQAAALDAINQRLDALAQDPDVAYGLLTKRYSLSGTGAPNDRPGHPQIHTTEFKRWYGDWSLAGRGGARDDVARGTEGARAGQGAERRGASVGDTLQRREDVDQSAAPGDRAGRITFTRTSGPTGEAGTPVRFYHGTRDDVAQFDLSHPNRKDHGWLGTGVYLSSSAYTASEYAWAKRGAAGQNIMAVYANVRNPYVMTKAQKDRLSRASRKVVDTQTQRLKDAGHDGVVMYDEDGHAELVVFDRVNVKSAIGNNGDFDPSNPLINRSEQRAGGGAGVAEAERQAVKDYIDRTLGGSVAVAWADLMHAGEFERTTTGDVIRLSVHGLSPQSTAYHEALHAFFAQQRDHGNHEINRVLEKAAATARVRKQLGEFFAGEPAVLKQIARDPEERAAYMYQLWAGGHLKLGPAATGVFQRVAAFLRRVLGIWSNDERALHILEYFHGGEYARNMAQPNAVARVLMDAGRNRAVEQVKQWSAPLMRLGESVFVTGAGRLRDTGNPAIARIADLVKREGTAEGRDPGFITAARVERSTRMNRLGEALGRYSREQINEALEALQSGTAAPSTEGKTAALTVKRVLRETFDYMTQAGVNISDRGPDYFPRVWDSHYISLHQGEFLGMLDKYVRSGQLAGDPRQIMRSLLANEGNDFAVDVRRPGMQNAKERMLDFIGGEDFAPFAEKDLFKTLSSYMAQATRRAEWARRFGDDGGHLKDLMQQARAQGASAKDIETVEAYLSGVTGTLGDDISPTARRITGNLIVYQNIRLLPLAIFSSIVDPLGIAVRGGTAGDAFAAFKRGVREIPRAFRKDRGDKDGDTALAELLGTIDNAALTHTLGALYTQGMVGGGAQKINDAFFRFNLMEGYNQSMRVAATQAAIQFIERHAQGDSPHSARWLSELGLTAADVRLRDGRMAVTPADGLSGDEFLKIRSAINQWVDGAVLRPDSADKPIWMNDPRWALVSHLKQFTYAFQRTILNRVAHEVRNGNYTPAYALLSYVPVMVVADLLKGMVQGGGEQPEWKQGWDLGDYLASGVQRAGLLGVGQFGVDVYSDIERGGAGLGALAGPTLDQLGDAAQAATGNGRFGALVLDAMPANALYSEAVRGGN